MTICNSLVLVVKWFQLRPTHSQPMNIQFKYDENRDIDCLLSKGPGSMNQPGSKTKTYLALEMFTPDIKNREKVREFVRKYISENKIGPEENCVSMKKDWDQIGRQFEDRAEKIFGVSIPNTIIAYLTITGRYPYNIKENFFYVSTNPINIRWTVMHEVWHFYTWNKFGEKEIGRLGSQKYNDLKEALTVILNHECAPIMQIIDPGYPQHQDLRKLIADTWLRTKDINETWKVAYDAVK